MSKSPSPLPQLTLVVQGSSNPLVLVCSAFPFLSPLPHLRDHDHGDHGLGNHGLGDHGLGDHGLGDHGFDDHGFDDDR